MNIWLILAVAAALIVLYVGFALYRNSEAWAKIKAWFRDSETIFWARMQVLLGIVAAVLPTLNPISWLDAALTPAQRWTAALFAIGNGLLTEYLRRRRATDL